MKYSYTDKVRVVDEVWGILSVHPSLSELLSTTSYKKRCGIGIKCLRECLLESSLGVFNGEIHYFNGKIYESMTLDMFKDMIYELMMVRVKLPYEDISSLWLYQSMALSAVRSKVLSVDNSIIVMKNGVLDVRSRELHAFDKKFVQTTMVDYEYMPGARTFMFYQFLNQVIPDARYQMVLQMFLGAIFVDRGMAKIETMLLLLGSGANGKSVIQAAVKSVLGEENVSEIGIAALCSSGSAGEQNVAQINGKRLNYCSEIQLSEFGRDSDRLKAIISGECVQARFLYANSFKARNIPLLMANANKLPLFKDRSKGMLRRIYVIPMNVEIPEIRQDKSLPSKLKQENPAILNWILEGYDLFVKNGYRLPESTDVSKLIENDEAEYVLPLKYMKYKDYLRRFDGVDMESVSWIPVRNLYDDFIRWCARNNETEEYTEIMFSRELEKAGFVKKRKQRGMSFAVYGKTVLNKIKQNKYETLKKNKDGTDVPILYVEGKRYVSGIKALATVAGCSVAAVTKRIHEGKFERYRMKNGEVDIFEVDKCIRILRKDGLLDSDKERRDKIKEQKNMKYIRYIFNSRMKYHGLPYRKYADKRQQIDGSIVVNDDMTDREAFEMAHRDFGFDLSSVRFGSEGAYGRGGKGFMAGLDEEEEEIIND